MVLLLHRRKDRLDKAVLDVTIDQLDEIIKSNKKVFVDVWATWCMPCKVMSSIFEDIADKYEEILFVCVEADSSDIVGDRLDIKSIPSFLGYKESALLNKKTGMMTVDELEEMVKLF